MLHPYEPGKIPVVFVHGLRSSPLAWLKVINELWGDPALRDRYQFWLFMYPTGKPFPSSAAGLRQDLDELRRVDRPGHADPVLDRMVLIGHSMGGLISKMMIARAATRSGSWSATGRSRSCGPSPEQREQLLRVFFFEPEPSVARVVFIATPHRGSELGDQFIGRLADRLIRLPGPLRRPTGRCWRRTAPSSSRRVRAKACPPASTSSGPTTRCSRRSPGCPVSRGSRSTRSSAGRPDAVPVEASSDGVVPYTSSHLDWAGVRAVVPGNHSCQDIPETIEELKRILRLHLGVKRPEIHM